LSFRIVRFAIRRPRGDMAPCMPQPAQVKNLCISHVVFMQALKELEAKQKIFVRAHTHDEVHTYACQARRLHGLLSSLFARCHSRRSNMCFFVCVSLIVCVRVRVCVHLCVGNVLAPGRPPTRFARSFPSTGTPLSTTTYGADLTARHLRAYSVRAFVRKRVRAKSIARGLW
jgi:hypothetical protein